MVFDDIFYADTEINQVSLTKLDGYMKLSERLKTSPKFQGLKLVPSNGGWETGSRSTINFKELKKVLLGKPEDAKAFKERYNDGLLRFLDGQDMWGDKVCY